MQIFIMHAVNTHKQFYIIFSINEIKRYLLNKSIYHAISVSSSLSTVAIALPYIVRVLFSNYEIDIE